jgi:poly(A) polymerase
MRLRLSDLKTFTFLKTISKLAVQRKKTAYLVGGALRDCLLIREREYLDFDFAISGHSLTFARELAARLEAPFVLLDEPHGCARVVYKDKGLSVNLDFSDFRAPTIAVDLEKRDFTINAMALKIEDIFLRGYDIGRFIIDPYGSRQDLKKKIIRLVHRSSFSDDPLRMLRAFSLAARLNFKIASGTLNKVKKQRRLIKKTAGERLREELLKLLSAKNSYPCFLLLSKSGLFEELIPEIKPMYRLRQGAYHHLDVWKHTLATLKELEEIINASMRSADLKKYLSEEISGGHKRLGILKFICVLHDIGKPSTFRRQADKVHFYGHERVGAKISEAIAYRLRFSAKEIRMLKNIIYSHLRPGHMADIENLSQRAIFRYFRSCQEEAVSVALLSLADQRATRGRLQRTKQRARHEKLIRFLIRKFFKQLKEKKETPLINGHDVMREFKLEPGPVIGKILTEVREAQAEESVRTKEQALLWAKRFYKQI